MRQALIAFATLAIAVGVLVTRAWDSSGETTSPATTKPTSIETLAARPPDRDPPSEQARAHDPTSAAPLDSTVQVDYKYRFLLEDLSLEDATLQRLKLLLQARESAIRDSEGAAGITLATIDNDVRSLLPAADFERYVAFADSDTEQRQLDDYLGGISNVAPLDERQERAVLEAKLRQKQRYRQTVRDLGLDRDTLAPADREYAHQVAARAMKQYRDDYLADVAPALSAEQYQLLSDYERTEFMDRLARLQQAINAK
jgi:hypothetical protein